MWELYSAKVFIAQEDFKANKISKDGFKVILISLQKLLEEAQRCLMFSEEKSLEMQIFGLSKKALMFVKDTLAFVDFI